MRVFLAPPRFVGDRRSGDRSRSRSAACGPGVQVHGRRRQDDLLATRRAMPRPKPLKLPRDPKGNTTNPHMCAQLLDETRRLDAEADKDAKRGRAETGGPREAAAEDDEALRGALRRRRARAGGTSQSGPQPRWPRGRLAVRRSTVRAGRGVARRPRPALTSGSVTACADRGYGAVRCGIAIASTKNSWNLGATAVSIFSMRRTRVFDRRARALVEERDARARAGGVAGRADLVERAIGNHAEHHRVLDVDVAAEGAGQADAVDVVDRRGAPSAGARRRRAPPWRAGSRGRRSA